jgi:hypothetical protein
MFTLQIAQTMYYVVLNGETINFFVIPFYLQSVLVHSANYA